MRIAVPSHLPGWPQTAVFAELSIAAGPDESCTVSVKLRSLVSLDLLAYEVYPPCTWKDLPEKLEEVLPALQDALGTLLDYPPFT